MWRACGLRLLADPGIVRLGAWSFWPLIMIRGPYLVHPLDMIFSSAAMATNWPGAACLTSIVNFFIFPFFRSFFIECWNDQNTTCFQISWAPFCRLSSGATTVMLKFCLSKLSYLNSSYIISGYLSSLKLAAWSLSLNSFFFRMIFRIILNWHY